MTKGEETRLRNLVAKSRTQKLSDLETYFLNKLKLKQKSEMRKAPNVEK